MLFLIGVLVLSACIIIFTREAVNGKYLFYQKALRRAQDDYRALKDKSRVLAVQRGLLEGEYENITTLYEVMKNISRHLSRQDVFKAFMETVRSFVPIGECLLLSGEDLSKIDKSGYFIFTLDITEGQASPQSIGGQASPQSIGGQASPQSIGGQASPQSIGGQARLNDVVGQAEALAVSGLKDKDKDKFILLANQFALALRRAEFYRLIQELSITDGLTRALVKRYCLQRLTEELLRSKRKGLNFSCAMLDIDKFKDYNDKFGHLVGDVVLSEASRIIKDNIRQIDMLGRFGGEEFLLLLPETNKQAAFFAAERIRSAIEKNVIRAYDETLTLTISIGVASFPDDSKDDGELVDKADKALYQAKGLGRNRVCLYSTK